MKIAFFSNFLNHHQLPFCEALMGIPDVEFKFVARCKTEDDRISMGYEDMNNVYPFVVKAYENEEEAIKIAEEYDVALMGDTLLKYLDARMHKNKLTFRVTERPLKKGTWRRFIPRTQKKIYQNFTKYKDDNMYLLGSGAFASNDMVLCGFDSKKCFSWGYFPKLEKKNIESLFEIKKNNKVPEILYAGRLLKLKHVIDTVKAVHKLVKNNAQVHFTIIGEGECKNQIKTYIDKNGLNNHITMLPFMPPEKVREYMNKSDIYVFGSDFNEGWGAVVNEAMNSACVTVASHSVGSAPVLIKDKENGFVYECGNINQLTRILSQAISDAEMRKQIGINAYDTICNEWSAQVAAERFYALASTILEGKDYKPLYESGPCSVAKIYKNNWIKGIK